MPESFGARLRQQREKCGLALEALAKQTRIKESLLEALERDDLSQWPTGFYRRAFFRAYASAIQLDPDATFREFQQLYPEPPEGDVLAAMAAALGMNGSRPRSGIRSAVESAFSSLARRKPSTPQSPEAPAVEPSAHAEPAASLAAAPEPERVDLIARADSAPRPQFVARVAPDSRPASRPESRLESRPDCVESIARAGHPARDDGSHERERVESTACSGQAVTMAAAPEPERIESLAPVESAEGIAAEPKPDRLDRTTPPEAADRAAQGSDPDLLEVARLCVELACVTDGDGMQSLLQHAARLINAAGLIVWVVDPSELQLQAGLVHGYPARLVAQLPMVRRNDSNATAEAFRTMRTRVFNDSRSGKAALAIPLRTAAGCVGVFAVELERGVKVTRARVAVATLLAAQLAPIADVLSRPAAFTLPAAVNGEMHTI